MKPRPDFDQAKLSTQTYLTIPELAAYLRFSTENACRIWLWRQPAIPRIRRGRSLLVLRRDVDRFLEPASAAPQETKRHLHVVGEGVNRGHGRSLARTSAVQKEHA